MPTHSLDFRAVLRTIAEQIIGVTGLAAGRRLETMKKITRSEYVSNKRLFSELIKGLMMNGGIFLIQSGGDLVEMKEQSYDTEAVLQELLAKYPNLLAGDQMDEAAPRRWLLISREMGIPSEEEGGDRWSLDHLFLDQDAIPTLLEAKRSTA